MIHYQLRCENDHGFDGWFRDSAGFEAQARHNLVSCPECGATDIRRALMAPALGRKGRDRAAEPPAAEAKPVPTVDQTGAPVPTPSNTQPAPPHARAGAVLPDQVRAALQRLRAEVERHCEDVGDSFATEARRIHAGETPGRGIYGNSTPEEAQSLADEGIEVARLPWVPRADG